MSSTLADPTLLARVRSQIEFYFSPQNLARDVYLRGLLEQDAASVPVAVIANFPKVKSLMINITNVEHIIFQALKGSNVVAVNLQMASLSPRVPLNQIQVVPPSTQQQKERTTVLLREVPIGVSLDEVMASLTTDDVKPKSAIPAYGDTWYVTFNTESDALSAVFASRSREIRGHPVLARIKSEAPPATAGVKNVSAVQPPVQHQQHPQGGYYMPVTTGPPGAVRGIPPPPPPGSIPIPPQFQGVPMMQQQTGRPHQGFPVSIHSHAFGYAPMSMHAPPINMQFVPNGVGSSNNGVSNNIRGGGQRFGNNNISGGVGGYNNNRRGSYGNNGSRSGGGSKHRDGNTYNSSNQHQRDVNNSGNEGRSNGNRSSGNDMNAGDIGNNKQMPKSKKGGNNKKRDSYSKGSSNHHSGGNNSKGNSGRSSRSSSESNMFDAAHFPSLGGKSKVNDDVVAAERKLSGYAQALLKKKQSEQPPVDFNASSAAMPDLDLSYQDLSLQDSNHVNEIAASISMNDLSLANELPSQHESVTIVEEKPLSPTLLVEKLDSNGATSGKVQVEELAKEENASNSSEIETKSATLSSNEEGRVSAWGSKKSFVDVVRQPM